MSRSDTEIGLCHEADVLLDLELSRKAATAALQPPTQAVPRSAGEQQQHDRQCRNPA
ncbi:uncharacterized protein LOC144158262 isoform X3 [Haemaphysalis longicornis]